MLISIKTKATALYRGFPESAVVRVKKKKKSCLSSPHGPDLEHVSNIRKVPHHVGMNTSCKLASINICDSQVKRMCRLNFQKGESNFVVLGT